QPDVIRSAPPLHYLYPDQRIQGPYEDGLTHSAPLGDDVETPVYAIAEVDVCVAGCTEHGRVAGPLAFEGMVCGIIGAVRLCLDDHPTGVPFRRAADQDAAEEFSCDDNRRACVE